MAVDKIALHKLQFAILFMIVSSLTALEVPLIRRTGNSATFLNEDRNLNRRMIWKIKAAVSNVSSPGSQPFSDEGEGCTATVIMISMWCSEELNNWENVEYVAHVTIGTPGQHFYILPDTASTSIWVPHKYCSHQSTKYSVKDNKSCLARNVFNENISSTFVPDGRPWDIEYGSGEASGILANDMLTLTDIRKEKKPLNLFVTFAVATYISSFFLDHTFDGILGLGLPLNDFVYGTKTILYQLLEKYHYHPIFTISLANMDSSVGGTLTFGDTGRHCSKSINFERLISPVQWHFRIFNLQLGNYKVTSHRGFEAVLDSGTSFIGGPPQIIDNIARAANASYNEETGLYNIACNAAPKSFRFQSRTRIYAIQSNNFIVRNEGICEFAFLRLERIGFGSHLTLGNPVARQYCIVHDFHNFRVGFSEMLRRTFRDYVIPWRRIRRSHSLEGTLPLDRLTYRKKKFFKITQISSMNHS